VVKKKLSEKTIQNGVTPPNRNKPVVGGLKTHRETKRNKMAGRRVNQKNTIKETKKTARKSEPTHDHRKRSRRKEKHSRPTKKVQGGTRKPGPEKKN